MKRLSGLSKQSCCSNRRAVAELADTQEVPGGKCGRVLRPRYANLPVHSGLSEISRDLGLPEKNGNALMHFKIKNMLEPHSCLCRSLKREQDG